MAIQKLSTALLKLSITMLIRILKAALWNGRVEAQHGYAQA